MVWVVCNELGFGHRREDLNYLGVLLHVLRAAGIIYYGYLALRLAF